MSQILLPWERGSLGKKFAWHYSMAYPRKPPYRRKNFADISYISRVIANFVPKFVAMATGVGTGKILMTPSDSAGPKIGGRCKQHAIFSSGGRVIANFVPKMTLKLADPENYTLEPKLRLYLIYSRSYDSLKHCLIFPIDAIVIFSSL